MKPPVQKPSPQHDCSVLVRHCHEHKYTTILIRTGKEIFSSIVVLVYPFCSLHPSSPFPYLQEVIAAHLDRFPKQGQLPRPEKAIQEIIKNVSTDFSGLNQQTDRERNSLTGQVGSGGPDIRIDNRNGSIRIDK